MTTYTYLGTFTSPDSDDDPTSAGIPAVAAYNPYNGASGTSVPLANNPAAQVSRSIVSFQNENTATTLPRENAVLRSRLTTAMFVVGGYAGFTNAFGAVVSSTQSADPSTIINRWILVPNTKSAIPSASTQPVADGTTVTGGYTIPVPANAAPTSGSIIGSDGHGINIADHTLQTYSTGANYYVYPFIIPNGWKYDFSAPSGSRWYVDVSIQPWWGIAASNLFPDTNTSHLVYDADSNYSIFPTNFAGTHSTFPNFGYSNIWGFEDFVINTAQSLNPPALNEDFNDFVFAYWSFD